MISERVKQLLLFICKFIVLIAALVVLATAITMSLASLYGEQEAKEFELVESLSTNDVSENVVSENVVSENTVSINNIDIVKSEIASLKSGDTEVVERWFGISDVYTSEFISRTTAKAEVLVSELDGTNKVVLYIKYTDYNNINNTIREMQDRGDTEEMIDSALAQMVVSADYVENETVEVTVENGKVMPSEKLKNLITGKAYPTY